MGPLPAADGKWASEEELQAAGADRLMWRLHWFRGRERVEG